MTTIGVADLRQNASKYLRMVSRGQIVHITSRGVPVARLVPEPTSDEEVQALIDAGIAQPPQSFDNSVWFEEVPDTNRTGMSSQELLDQIRADRF